jgi:hypothetical protein
MTCPNPTPYEKLKEARRQALAECERFIRLQREAEEKGVHKAVVFQLALKGRDAARRLKALCDAVEAARGNLV